MCLSLVWQCVDVIPGVVAICGCDRPKRDRADLYQWHPNIAGWRRENTPGEEHRAVLVCDMVALGGEEGSRSIESAAVPALRSDLSPSRGFSYGKTEQI